ncbi:MAG: hypothetical protein EOO09_00165 [Chitinophagaceae bacterium]|nr:MAG: hypothetical protein EOO09_00165 [Chitinophagaceae bacterium]
MKKTIISLAGCLLFVNLFSQKPTVSLSAPEANGNRIAEVSGVQAARLCPSQKSKGDLEFNPARSKVSAALKLSWNRNAVLLTMNVREKEQTDDLSETKGVSLDVVYKAPDGFVISGIGENDEAKFEFAGNRTLTQFRPGQLRSLLGLGPNDPMVDLDNGLVAGWEITQPTVKGKGSTCASHTQVAASLRPFKVYLKKQAAALPAQASTKEITITPDAVSEWLCPSAVVRGDREFDGHGPRIKCEVGIYVTKDGSSLMANISLSAVETVQDWSTTEGRWTKTIYEAPYGMKILGILSDTRSRTSFISPPGGIQFIVPGTDVAQALYTFLDNTDVKSAVLNAYGFGPEEKSLLSRLVKGTIDHGNTVVQVPSTEGTLVKFFHIVGDTGGPDISTDDNCNDDTRITKIEFFPVKLKVTSTK